MTLTPAAAQQAPPPVPSPYTRAIAAGYKASMLCAGIFTAGRTEAQIGADELGGIYPEYDAIVPTLSATVDRRTATVSVAFDAVMPPRRAAWRADRGCTIEPIGAIPRAVTPAAVPTPVAARADPRAWPVGDTVPAPRPSPALAAAVGRAFDGGYGGGTKTSGVAVLQEGAIVAERYAAGWGPLVANRTWSVAKSMAGTLVGMAVLRAEVDVTAPVGIGIWQLDAGLVRDPRAAITLNQLLRMASGLHSSTAGNRTDAIYFGGVTVDQETTAWPLAAQPGTRFRYANNDILLAMHALRFSNKGKREDFAAERLFEPLGMHHTVAGRDWHDDYILSSQVWSTVRDLARLGQFWLQDGVWAGKRLLPDGWMRYMTTASGPQPTSGPGYGATLWLFGPTQGLPQGSYAAQGNRGQYVMVIPSQKLVIVRRGEDPGAARFDIARFAADVAAALP